jgi:large subunit ribosomal protein L24|tara:strand:- start:115 stop:699 length:585 start_codon:yes stop_codon:yes gene_type:complete
MKKKFSTSWVGSVQPRKQRKYRANAPLHIKRKMMSSNLSKELRKKYDKRNIPIRKGDSVRIMTGEFKKKTGKIDSVENQKLRVTIEGLYRTKKDGTKVGVKFSPSNLQIKELVLEDRKRKVSLERKASSKSKKVVGLGNAKSDKLSKSSGSDNSDSKSDGVGDTKIDKKEAKESKMEKKTEDNKTKSKDKENKK